MRSIRNYLIQFALVSMLAISIAGCAPGGGQATTPVAPAPTATTVPVPTSQPTETTEMPQPMETANRPEPRPTATVGGGQDQGKDQGGQAMIDDIEVLIMESFPVQVTVNVKGNLSDACTTISDIVTTRAGNTFNIQIATARPADQMCAQVLTPFEENIPLDVKGLEKGTYTVNVNGITETFELAQDNQL